MKYRELGKTGLMVSEIGFGAEWVENESEETIIEIVRACEEAGINILDCWMPYPHTRTCLGKALEHTRDKWIIQGHIGATYQNGQYVKTREMDKVVPAFEDLLDKFKTDYIDLGMIHYVDKIDDYNNIMNGPFIEYVRKLRTDGVIRHTGLSTHNPEIVRRAISDGIIEMVMFSVNPAFDMVPPTDNVDDYFVEDYASELAGMDPERAAIYSLCEREGIGITVMKGYAGGRLFNAEASPFGIALTPVQCIHYALTRPAASSVLIGYSNADQVADAIRYETATEDEKDYASVLANAPEHRFGAECTYCGHCLPCPANIDIAMVNKFLDLALMQDEVPESIKGHYDDLDKNASDCIGCGGCETRCPFGVGIVDKMAKARALFG